jgi:uncharacterized protein (TIRG00374 family)
LNKRLLQRIGVGVGVAALVYLGMALYADWGPLRQALSGFRWPFLLAALLLSLVNYGVRFLRWQMYLRRSHIDLQAWLSLRIFLGSLVMSVTPGKMGELLKAYLVRSHNGTPLSRTGPIVVAERLTDLTALFLLIFVGSLVYRQGFLTVLVSAVVSLLLILGLASPRVAHLLLHAVERIPPLRRHGEKLERSLESMRSLLRPTWVLEATLLGTVAWFAECLGFVLVLMGFGLSVSLAYGTFVYAFATLVGALVLVPGGLGGTEITMVVMLMDVGATKELATASTLVIRLATLWFAVFLGAALLILDPRVTVPAEEIS